LPEALLLHGAGGGAWEWRLWAGVLACEGFSLRVPDLVPGANGLERTGLSDYLDQARAQRAAEAGDILIGASLGGLLALMLASEVRPAAMVLINPLPPSPLHRQLPAREWPDRVPWGSERDLAGTRRALFDADDATCLAAFRLWRDESGRALREASAGIEACVPECPILVWASERDEDVPHQVSRELAGRLGADFRLLRGASHCGPLLGRDANDCAAQTVAWLNALPGLRADSPASA